MAKSVELQHTTVETVDRWAAIVIFITALIGVLVNGFIGIYIHRLPILRNSFGRLLQLQAIGDCVFGCVWAFYFAPTLFFDIRPFQDLAIASRFAQLCLICYDISIYSHLIISINRFISLYFPTHYSGIFTDKFTNGLVIFTVVFSFAFSWFLVAVDCLMGFSIRRWMLDYQLDRCNLIYVHYAEFWRGLILIAIFAVVNALTFTRMHFVNNRKRIQGQSTYESIQQMKRRAVERTFIQQVTLQGIIYAIELITYFYVAVAFPVDDETIQTDSNRWPNFLLTTYAWISVHTLDGLVTLAFNRQFRRVLTTPFRSHSKTSDGNMKTHSHLPVSGQSHVNIQFESS
ncbi:unnamed protein product [Auanema sp. JU1783]|nr:unnamed protein product [Auanema sp. JU1783]